MEDIIYKYDKMEMKRKMSNTLGAGLLLLASTLGVSAQAQQVFLHSGEPVVDWKLKPQAESKGGCKHFVQCRL